MVDGGIVFVVVLCVLGIAAMTVLIQNFRLAHIQGILSGEGGRAKAELVQFAGIAAFTTVCALVGNFAARYKGIAINESYALVGIMYGLPVLTWITMAAYWVSLRENVSDEEVDAAAVAAAVAAAEEETAIRNQGEELRRHGRRVAEEHAKEGEGLSARGKYFSSLGLVGLDALKR